jgi:glutamate-1-semialdehyde 2,1-aminomutase
MSEIQNLYKKAKNIIPGGTQLLSKRPEMFLPNQWPTYYKNAKGCEVEDIDGNKLIDMCYMGIGSCTLGYADEDVNIAAKNAIDSGSMCTLNPVEDVELAELLCELNPWAQQVRYTRSGGEAMAVAVRIARAHTQRDKILFCGYHGWHDWYLSANLGAEDALADGHLLPGLNPLGVPRGLKGTAIPFAYNNTNEFLKALTDNKDEIAGIIVETVRNIFPDNQFFETIKEVCTKNNIVLIFDEITSGFRLFAGGAHMMFAKSLDDNNASNIFEPDMAVYAKAMTNGFPMAAVVGKEHVMSVSQDTFISSLYWTDKIGPAATLATIKKIINNNVPAYTERLGKKMQKIWLDCAKKYDLNINITGPVPQLSIFAFNYKNALAIKTLFIQEMLKKGFLTTTAFYPCYKHDNSHLDSYAHALEEVFQKIKKAIENNNVESMLNGPICHDGFKRLT